MPEDSPSVAPAGLSRQEITRVVNRYIGVEGGYLGDFSCRTHSDFYPEYCDLDIDPSAHQGTTRERFISILSSSEPRSQAKILRGVVARFPVGDGPPTRTLEAREALLRLAQRLEGGALVQVAGLRITSKIVETAITDAETLVGSRGAASGIDRIHTALHGYLIAACRDASVEPPSDANTTTLFKLLRRSHSRLADLGPRADDIERILNACSTILDAANPLRNRASVAHPNAAILGDAEARLVVNVARTMLGYLDARLIPDA